MIVRYDTEADATDITLQHADVAHTVEVIDFPVGRRRQGRPTGRDRYAGPASRHRRRRASSHCREVPHHRHCQHQGGPCWPHPPSRAEAKQRPASACRSTGTPSKRHSGPARQGINSPPSQAARSTGSADDENAELDRPFAHGSTACSHPTPGAQASTWWSTVRTDSTRRWAIWPLCSPSTTASGPAAHAASSCTRFVVLAGRGPRGRVRAPRWRRRRATIAAAGRDSRRCSS